MTKINLQLTVKNSSNFSKSNLTNQRFYYKIFYKTSLIRKFCTPFFLWVLLKRNYEYLSHHPTIHKTIQKFNHLTIQPPNHSCIQQSNHPTIQRSNHSCIQPSYYPTIQPSNYPTIQPSNHIHTSNHKTYQIPVYSS